MKALVVEDNPLTAQTLLQGLKPSYVIDIAPTIMNARNFLEAQSYDVIILDIILPDGNGMEFCAELRKKDKVTPILMLSAKDAVSNKIQAFHAGANEYMTKPFSFEELVARMQLIRKHGQVGIKKDCPTRFSVDPLQRCAVKDGRELPLSKKEFDILEYLIDHEGQVVTRASLLEHAWNTETDISFNTIDAHIKNIRRKLRNGGVSNVIDTIRGVGYRVKSS